jgi:hypothetical protein
LFDFHVLLGKGKLNNQPIFFDVEKQKIENLFFITLFFNFPLLFFNIVDYEMKIWFYLMFFFYKFEKQLNYAKDRKIIYLFQRKLNT